MKEKKYICRCWNDNPPIDCGGCSCVKIHDKWTKDFFLENEMCDYYDSIIVDEELERKIHEEAHRSVLYCTACGALEWFDCVCNNENEEL